MALEMCEDGTYKDGKFICTNCYCKLIPLGLDKGSPNTLHAQIRILKAKGQWKL